MFSSHLLFLYITHIYFDNSMGLLLILLLRCSNMVCPSATTARSRIILSPSTRISYVILASLLGSCLLLIIRSGLTNLLLIVLSSCRINRKEPSWLGKHDLWGHAQVDPKMDHLFSWVLGCCQFRSKFRTYPW